MQNSMLIQTRLASQQLVATRFSGVKELVSWMGAMQSQDYAMSKLAIGQRLACATESMVENAVSNGEIIRTHVLRPTWHFVAPQDLRWMLQLSATRIRAAMKTNDKLLGIDDAVYKKTNRIIANILTAKEYAVREEIVVALQKVKIDTGNNRMSHFMMRAELDGIACNGPSVGKQRSYALLDKWVAPQKHLPKDAALALLATKFFSSHGPATVADFAWWGGLTGKDAKEATEMVRRSFETTQMAAQEYFFKPADEQALKTKSAIHLLPAFDEFLVAYANRSAALAIEHHPKAVSNNGIFRPVIVEKNKVAGTWKKSIQKDRLEITFSLFSSTPSVTKKMQRAVEGLKAFYGAATAVVTLAKE